MDSEKDLKTAVWEAQEGVNLWGGLLIGTGTDFQPPKCNWMIHAMHPKDDITWEYMAPSQRNNTEDNKGLEDRTLNNQTLKVPQANSEAVTIKQLMHSKAEKYLGLHTHPDRIPSRQDPVQTGSSNRTLTKCARESRSGPHSSMREVSPND